MTARVDLNALRFVRRDDLDAFIGGTVDLSLADGGGAVKGDLTLEPVEVRLLDNLPPSVVVLDITEESDAQAEKAAAAPPQKALDLDVTVNIPRRAFVRGRRARNFYVGLPYSEAVLDEPVDDVKRRMGLEDRPAARASDVAAYVGWVLVGVVVDVTALFTTVPLMLGLGLWGRLTGPSARPA